MCGSGWGGCGAGPGRICVLLLVACRFRAERLINLKNKNKKMEIQKMSIANANYCCMHLLPCSSHFLQQQGGGFPSSFVSLGRKPVWISLDRDASQV